MQAILLRVADWVRQSREELYPCIVPSWLVPDMLAMPHERVPMLQGLTTLPILRADGTLISSPGFDPSSQLLLTASPGLTLEQLMVPEEPSVAERQAALDLVMGELLGDIPFAQARDRAHALAALLLPFVRHWIEGPTPLHLIEAPTEGTGKTLLARLIWQLSTGMEAAPTPVPAQEEELRKKILSLLLEAPTLILLDNLSHSLDSPSLASVLTTTLWKDRPLGQSTTLEAPNRAIWLATANNPSLSREVSRRVIRIRLDAQTENPWMRAGFRHPDLEEWALTHRNALVSALLTLVRAWIRAGSPPGKNVLGSYASWSKLLGGILLHAEVDGFLAQQEEDIQIVEPEEHDWQTLVNAWGEVHGELLVASKELMALASQLELFELDSPRQERSARARFTRALALRRDRIYGPWRIQISRDRHTKQNVYALRRLAQPTESRSHPPT